jgi:hypothetical protein
MAAHSSAQQIIPPVPPDQPPGGWPEWLRAIAAALNLTGAWVQTPVLAGLTVDTLPQEPAVGTLAMVTDASVATWGGVAAGGGTTPCLLWFNGTDWKVLGA